MEKQTANGCQVWISSGSADFPLYYTSNLFLFCRPMQVDLVVQAMT